MRVLFAVAVCAAVIVCRTYGRSVSGSVLKLPPGSSGYVGNVHKDTKDVELFPELEILPDTGPVCSYKLSSSEQQPDNHDLLDSMPFEFDVLNNKTGQARLRIKADSKLSCERSAYKYTLAAQACSGELSESVLLTINVPRESNLHAPVFAKAWFEVSLEEGRTYVEILRLEATDDDCAGRFSRICRYEITNNARQFTISNSGILKNTKPLNRTLSESYLLTIVAYDCGGLRSNEAVVSISVKHFCSVGWSHVPTHLTYESGSAPLRVFEGTELEPCDLSCEIQYAEAIVAVDMEQNGRGCDRASLSVKAQKDVCGINEATVELLPTEVDNNEIPMYSGMDRVYKFDGLSTAITVSPTLMKSTIPNKFTLAFWMKHGNQIDENHLSGHKENILCSSDDIKRNRHHFSLYLHNCKLELLFRQEPPNGIRNGGGPVFKPTEWRWKLAESCDDEWHQYTMLMNYPNVELFVDGRHFSDVESNPEILDDTPINFIKGVKTKLAIGACWHGGAQKMAQFFKGELSSLTLLPGHIETQDVLRCLHRCQESLEFKGGDELQKPGMEAIFNTEMSRLTLKAPTITDLSDIVQKVAYVNHKSQTSITQREVTLNSSIKCKHLQNLIEIQPAKTVVGLVSLSEPTIAISNDAAATSLSAAAEQLKHGFSVFSAVSISITRKSADGLSTEVSGAKLDSCRIVIEPSLAHDAERLTTPSNVIGPIGLDFQTTSDGLLLSGHETAAHYMNVLRNVHYFNDFPNSMKNGDKRIFMLSCAMQHESVISNQISVTVNTLKTLDLSTMALAVEKERKSKQNNNSNETQPKQQHEMSMHDYHNAKPVESYQQISKAHNNLPLPLLQEYDMRSSTSAEAGGAVAIVVVVCVGFLLALAIVGVIRIRNNVKQHRKGYSRRSSRGEGDLSWDDSGMNIIVNPLMLKDGHTSVDVATETANTAEADEDDSEYSECDDDDAEDCQHDDGLTDDEEIFKHASKLKRARSGVLEWDEDPHLEPPTTAFNRERAPIHEQTYRV